jgi:hypothetical protein
MTRTPHGWEMCHRDARPASEAPHVRDRAWHSGGKTPLVVLGVPCGEACGWPEYVLPYLGCKPGASTVATRGPAQPMPARRTGRRKADVNSPARVLGPGF